MSKLLKDEIAEAENIVYEKISELNTARLNVTILKSKRKDCNHSFSAPLKNFEHEGGYCIYCGINELAAQTYTTK